MTLVLVPLPWCLGFLSDFCLGTNASQALLKATGYTLAGLAGWSVYLLMSRTLLVGRPNYPAGFAQAGLMTNIILLGPKKDIMAVLQIVWLHDYTFGGNRSAHLSCALLIFSSRQECPRTGCPSPLR
jgi:hypothetical protein